MVGNEYLPVAIALGSNLPGRRGDPLATLRWAVSALEPLARPGTLCCSPWFRSAAVGGPPHQPDYINGVVLMQCRGTAEALLGQLQALEKQAGRVPGPHWGPRCLDLDLLWFGDHRQTTPYLQLPHPRWQQRSFVLAPLVALDPQLVAPHAQLDCQTLLEQCPMPCPQWCAMALAPTTTMDHCPPEPAQLLDVVANLQVRKVSFELARWRLPIGAEGIYGRIRHPGACMAVPMLTDGRVLILRQYRFAVGRRLLEFPAGTLEVGEEPLASIQRELAEETGYSAARWDLLGHLLPCPAYSDEVIHLFLARELSPLPDPPAGDADEDLEVRVLTQQVLEQCFSQGEELLESKTVTAWFKARAFLAREVG